MTPQRWPSAGAAALARTSALADGSSIDPASTDLAPDRSSDSFTILGRQLDSRLYTPSLRAWLERYWRYDEHRLERHPYRIRLTEHAAALEIAAAGDGFPIDVRLPGQLRLRWNTREGEWHSGGEATGVRASFETGESRIGVWGTMDTSVAATTEARTVSSVAPWPALYVALCEALRASGLVPLHAAVVVRDGAAIALTGPSGTGKTTTLLRLFERGWHPLAEDFSWLDPVSRTLYGWDRGLRLWPDGLARLAPSMAAAPWTTDRDGKRLLEWGAVPAARVPQAKLTRIVLLERDATRPSSITSLSRRVAVRVLWEATGVPLIPWVRETMAQHIARLAHAVDLAHLTLGTGNLPEPDTLSA